MIARLTICSWSLSCVWLFVTPCTVVSQAPLSMGILQARIPEWAAMPSSRVSSQPKDQTQVSCIAGRFFTSWATREAQEYWSGLPIPSPMDLPNPGIEPGSSALQADSLPVSYQGSPKNSEVGCHVLLEGIFRTQGLNQVLCIADGFFTVWATREACERFIMMII